MFYTPQFGSNSTMFSPTFGGLFLYFWATIVSCIHFSLEKLKVVGRRAGTQRDQALLEPRRKLFFLYFFQINICRGFPIVWRRMM